jgi:hypothetical protein
VVGDWKIMHNKQLHGLCCSPNVIGRSNGEYGMGVACGVYRLEREGRRPLLWRKLKDNIKVDLKLLV